MEAGGGIKSGRLPSPARNVGHLAGLFIGRRAMLTAYLEIGAAICTAITVALVFYFDEKAKQEEAERVARGERKE